MTLAEAVASSSSIRRPAWRGFYVTNKGDTLAWTDGNGVEHVQTFTANPAELVVGDWEPAHAGA